MGIRKEHINSKIVRQNRNIEFSLSHLQNRQKLFISECKPLFDKNRNFHNKKKLFKSVEEKSLQQPRRQSPYTAPVNISNEETERGGGVEDAKF